MEQNYVNILGIAPYDAMARAMESTAENYPNILMDVYIGDLDEGVDIVRAHLGDGYDCIISRGGTAEFIRRITDIPVIEIPLSIYDVLRTIKLAENYSHLYAIVGFPSITATAHTLCDLLQYDIDIFTVHNSEEVRKTLTKLQKNGYKMVVSDVVTHTVARQMGMNAFLITSGTESLMSAFDKAAALGSCIHRLRQENCFLRSIDTFDDNRLIVLDGNGDMYYSVSNNAVSGDMLALLKEHIHDIPEKSVAKFYENYHGELYSISGKLMLLNNTRYYLFHCQTSQISFRSLKTGIRHYNRNECENLFLKSFYSISGAMGELDETITSIAKTLQPVVIIGEVGTGKEQIARAIYLRSGLTNKPFTVINCAALDDKTWDFLMNRHNSPLSDSKCTVYFQYFEALGLDRTKELVALIRETGLVHRERLIFSFSCDKNKNLPEEGKKISNRLECLTVHLSPLRNRSDEIPSLASLYIGNLNAELGKQISGFDAHAIEQLQNYEWPHNHSQFRKVLTELAAISDSTYIRGSLVADVLYEERLLNKPGSSVAADPNTAPRTLSEITRQAIQDALSSNNGNQTAAARQLGISRTTFWRYLNNSEQ